MPEAGVIPVLAYSNLRESRRLVMPSLRLLAPPLDRDHHVQLEAVTGDR